MTFAYIISAIASLYIYGLALLLAYFVINYYGYHPLFEYITPILLAPLVVPFVVGCLALVRRIRSKSYLRFHGTISGICGLGTCALALLLLVVETDYFHAGSLFVGGLLMSAPMLVGLLSDKRLS